MQRLRENERGVIENKFAAGTSILLTDFCKT